MKSTIHKMSHISKTTHAISMKFSLNVIHDIWTRKMQKGKNIFSLIWTHFLSHCHIYDTMIGLDVYSTMLFNGT